jgi:hypothetical protein
LKIIGIGNENYGDNEGEIVKEFGGIFLGPRLGELEKFLKEDDEVVIVDSSKNFRFLIIGLKELYPGVLGYSELENYLLNAKIDGIKAKITIIAFSNEYRDKVKCFLNCILLKK